MRAADLGARRHSRPPWCPCRLHTDSVSDGRGVGVVGGGTNASSVPDWARIEVDRRTIPGEDHGAVQAELEAVVESVRADVPGLDYSFDHHDLNVPPLETPEDAAFLEVVDNGHDRSKPPRPVFTGWMFASSPAVSAMEHPVYDLTLLSCKSD